MKNILATLLVIAAFAVTIGITTVDAVSVGPTYSYSNYTSTNASTTPIVVRTGFGEMGSLIINSATSTGVVTIYDEAIATTTGTVIARTSSSTPAGTYTYEVQVNKGVVVSIPVGFTGNITLTAR